MRKTNCIGKILIIYSLLIGAMIISRTIFTARHVVAADSTTANIIPYTREPGSGTRGAFVTLTNLESRNYLGEAEDKTSENIAIMGSSEEMLIQVSNTPDGLGYVSYAYMKDTDKAKVLKVNDVDLTDESIRTGAYPLIRPFQLVYQGDMSDVEADFMRFVKSEGQGYIRQYCVPARNQGIFLESGAEGSLIISGSSSMTPMMKTLVNAYEKANPNVKVEVISSDSEAGMLDVIQGTSNFAMVSRELKQYEQELLSAERIGSDAIAIIVNPENEVANITTSQLKKIYEKSLLSWKYLRVYQ